MNWYETNIEEPIREIVRLLRDNGINTECSCGHEMYVQFQVMDILTLQDVDRLLFDTGYKDYRIEYFNERRNEYMFTSATVYFLVDGKFPIQAEKTAAMEQYLVRWQKK